MRNNKLELYINGNLVDVESTEQLAQQFALTISFSDLYKPDAITDTYSQEIQLPGTNRNNQIFGSIWRIDADNYTVFNPSMLSNFKVLLNGELWKTGTVQLKKITQRNKNVTYSIVLYGVITGLFSTLLNNDPDDPENKLMRSLPYPNDLKHSINSEYIYNDWYRTTEYSQYFNYVPCQNGIHENFESSKWLTKWGSASSPICCQDITACEPPTIDSGGDLTIPDGTGMNFDEYRIGEYRSQYQRPALRVKKAVDLILEDIAPDYDISLDTTDFFSESDQVLSPYNSVFMTLNQYNTEKDDEDFVSYNNINQYTWTYGYSTPQSRESSHDYVDIKLNFNQQVYGTYDFLHADGYFYPDELPGNNKKLEVEFEMNFGVEDISGIRRQSLIAYLTEGTSLSGVNLPVQVLVKDENDVIRATGTPYKSNITPMTQPGGELTDNYFNGTLSCRRQSDPVQIKLGISCPHNPVNGFKRAVYGQSSMNADPAVMGGPNLNFLMLKFGEVYGFCQEMKDFGGFSTTSHPYKQTIDISSVNRKFTIWVRISNLTNCQFYGNVYSPRPDARTHSDQETYVIGVRPIQKMTTLSKPFPVNHGYRGVDLRAYFLNKIQSGSIVSKYDMFDGSLSQGEFLLSLTKLTGCLYDVDKEGKVTIKSRNAFFNGYKILDWSDKLDYSKDIVYDPLTFDTRKLSMKYNPGDSYYEEKYKKQYNTEYGEKRINTGYAYNTDTTELLADDIIFQNVVICKDNDIWSHTCGNSTIYTSKNHPLMMPAYYTREGNDKKPSNNKYGLVFRGDIMDTDAIYITDDNPLMFDEDLGGNEDNPCWINSETGDATVNSTIYMPGSEAYPAHTGHWIYEMPTWTNFKLYGGNYNYDWNITRPTTNYAGWTSDTYPEGTGVYDRFWKSYITEIYNVKNKVMTAYFNLTAEDLLNFHFRNFVIINNTLWHPNKVFDINPLSDATTKVELIKVTDISSYTSGQNLTWVEYE